MKKIKIISMLLCVVTVLCAMALTANAKWWDENPFTDVKSSHWYYDAVRICNKNDIFTGTSENKYSPSVKMTRAMLVKALANLDGYTEAYKGTTPFTDV
ncbi:MAG: S-layer homology domain-containing protein, partial [Clostridia bacterium]|nr:S-layer homology domain-containing protein [Clostridia bacterium]